MSYESKNSDRKQQEKCKRKKELRCCNEVCCFDGHVVVVGEKMKDESMKMNRENYDDVMGWLDTTLFLPLILFLLQWHEVII